MLFIRELWTPLIIARNIFTFLTVPIYVLFLAVLIRFRKKAPFNSAFFRLSLVTGFVDLWSIAHNYFIYEYSALALTTELLRPLHS